MANGFFTPSSWEGPPGKKIRHLASCGECGLSSKCFTPRMEPTGTGRKSILFVAEAPGEKEDRQGVQLIGKAGQLLRSNLKQIHQNLDDAWKTNAVICRPPDNEINDIYIESCRPNIIKTIKKLKPNVIILLGKSAIKSVIGAEWSKSIDGLGTWIGWTIPSVTYNAWLCPTYHPSYIERKGKDELLEKILRRHLKQAYKLENKKPEYLDIEKEKEKIELIKKPRLARARLRDLSKKEGILAFDYETTGLKPESGAQRIVSCSFCLDGKDTFAMMINDSLHEYLRKILTNPKLKKVASNLKFEHRWTLAKLGIFIASWYWDTMLTAHILDNRKGITSVKFQSYILFGVNDYDSHISPYLKSPQANGLNRIDELDIDDLLMYNGLDSLLEYKVMEKQRATLYGRSK